MIPSGKTQITSSDEAWCSLYLIRGFPMSLRKMQDKIRRGAYESLTGFSSDVSDIVHHVGILFGVSSEQMEAAKYMLNDSTFDLSEIRQCRDCYRHSNEQDDPLWFAKPCLPRHELVFAKQKGYTYWPAKVIKINADGNYDVRFFGGKHFRGIIDPQCVKPIDTPYQDMQLMKRTVTLNKALEELQKHQELLKRPNSMFTYKAEQSKRSQRSTTPEEADTDDETKPVAPAKKKKAGRKPKSNAGDKSANKMVPTVKLTRTLQVSNGGGNYDTKPKPRMTRNSLVTAPDMNVYDISTVDEEEKTLDVRLKTPKKTPKKSLWPENDESADVDVVSLCNSSDEEGNLITMKTIDYIGETDYSSKPTRAKAHSSIGSSQEALISSTQEIPSTSQNNSNSTSNSSNANRSGAVSKQGEAPRLARATQGGGVSRRENFERIKLKVEQASSMKEAARIAHEALMAENERWEAELQAMVDEHVKSILFEVKKRQWCYYCGDEAIYYCCWNTAYCSTTCQQQHWQAEHKRVCRRKR
ncbi:zinc finger MYND domain-containing protein 11-like [Ctenocephalides felis]|uniref:zinc finger MYND domain-containing protein 11-like n=1 Tax=Ctenocephalides felis TaxID=7515 RepID=UPI000E6E5AEB|nr:zinc finger MYND domain-containing protein 11-like [Ctenocephalides felis]